MVAGVRPMSCDASRIVSCVIVSSCGAPRAGLPRGARRQSAGVISERAPAGKGRARSVILYDDEQTDGREHETAGQVAIAGEERQVEPLDAARRRPGDG